MIKIKIERATSPKKLRLIISFGSESEAQKFMENSELQFAHYVLNERHCYMTLIDNIDIPE